MKKITLALALSAMILSAGFSQSTTSRGGTSSSSSTGSTSTSSTSSSTSTTYNKKNEAKGEKNNSKDPKATASEWTSKVDEVVGLDANQKKKIQEINERYAKQTEDLKTKYSSSDNRDKDAFKKERDQLADKRFAEYNKVFNADQKKKFDEKRKEVNSKGGSNMSKDEKREKYQNMTPEQQQQMKEKKEEKKQEKSSSSSSSSTSNQ